MAQIIAAPVSMSQSLSALFSALTSLLHQYAEYWRPVAFREHQLPWMERHPGLVARLYALEPNQIDRLSDDAAALTDFMAVDLPFAQTLYSLTALPAFSRRETAAVHPRFRAGIPGRKWQQVEGFASSLPDVTLPILEWCAGKSHLGFYLHACSGQPVTALERDAALVEQANTRARQEGVMLHSVVADVLTPAAAAFVQPAQQVVALHACGDLHERLLDLCVTRGVHRLHVAPCCYHKRTEDEYVPMSQQGREAALTLHKSELHTAVMETVTASASVRRQRIQLQMMRLGFDCLQRDVRGDDSFLPVPSLPARWAQADFAEFCLHCATLKGIELPATIDWQYYQQQGGQRFRQVSALDLVRFLFRRPLEIWLALDRALLLQEHGYAVRLGTFCSARVTPRNLLIQGQRT